MTNFTNSTALPTNIDHITADWLTNVLSTKYPGTVVKSVFIGTVISGTATKVRLMLEYNEAGHQHKLPPTVWLKGGFIRHEHTYDNSFIMEAIFFDEWAPELSINNPVCYWAHHCQEQHQGLVLLEDLCSRNVSFGSSPHPISVEQQMRTLELMAQYHAKWWKSPKLNNINSFSELWADADQVLMRTLEPTYFGQCTDSERGAMLTSEYRDPKCVEKMLRACWGGAKQFAHCFSHGDAHLGNMYFELDGSPGFLDWQTWQSAPFGHDVTYSIIGNLKIEDRRASERDLLEHYIECLKANGVKDAPSFDEVWHAYRCHASHGFMWISCPVEMQPDEIVIPNAHRFSAAVSDLDTLGALGV